MPTRVLLSTIGSRGDVQPLVALALQVRALGHDAHLCVPPDFRDWIAGFGLPVTPIGPEVRKFAASRPKAGSDPRPFSPELARQMVDDSVATQFETITLAARGCDVIVAATALQVAARSVAETMGVPYVFAAYSPVVLPSPHHAPPSSPPAPGQGATAVPDNRELWARDAARFNETFAAPLNRHRALRGLAAVADVRSHMFTDRAWLAADAALAPWPGSAGDGVVQAGAWILEDERPLPADLERFLAAGDAPVYCGFGSTGAPDDLARTMIQAGHAVGRRAILSRGWADLSPIADDPDCLTIDDVNLRALFGRVAAVVHHGGAGTTTLAALAGAPQVVIPQRYDQHYWAERVQHAGIGAARAPGVSTTDSLTKALEQALQGDVVDRARTMAVAMRRDGAHAAARRLVEETDSLA